jgi:hypothetical protein
MAKVGDTSVFFQVGKDFGLTATTALATMKSTKITRATIASRHKYQIVR